MVWFGLARDKTSLAGEWAKPFLFGTGMARVLGPSGSISLVTVGVPALCLLQVVLVVLF